MKKGIKLLIILLVMLFGIGVVRAEVVATDLKETIDEELETFASYADEEGYSEYYKVLENANLKNYKESKKKVNVYVFRGNTCYYCFKSIAFFARIVPDYGKYFNLVTYEVWANEDNSELMSQVISALGTESGGVPLIIVGDQTFIGYEESMDDEIISQIKEEYNSDDKYDVMDHLGEVKDTSDDEDEEDNDESTNSSKFSTETILSWVFIVLLFVCSLMYTNYKISELKKEYSDVFKEDVNEEEIIEKEKEEIVDEEKKKATRTKKKD